MVEEVVENECGVIRGTVFSGVLRSDMEDRRDMKSL
jgi:hypothetical protein